MHAWFARQSVLNSVLTPDVACLQAPDCLATHAHMILILSNGCSSHVHALFACQLVPLMCSLCMSESFLDTKFAQSVLLMLLNTASLAPHYRLIRIILAFTFC